MGAVVLTNPRHPRNGLQVLVLNGTGQTANTFKPLAQAIFADQFGGIVSRMVLLNYPGHGNSGYPVGVKFGDLTIGDYVTSLLASIESLTPMGLRPNVLLGHSLGAEIIMLAQQRLLNQGTTLRGKYGIRGALFLVPDIPGPLPWAFVDSGMAAPLVGQLVRPDPVLGNVLDVPPPVWVSLFYSDRNGALAPGATTPDEAVNKGYISLDSATVGAELLGLNGARPLVNSGLFSNNRGTVASVITFEQDSLYVFPLEHQNLYSYLTFDQSGKLFFTVGGAQSVHNLHVINPGAILTAVKTALLSCR
ncbi:MAG TPA: alpha/beta hydrolase [Blastocatellia bacterium]|nr:alpha/beta hydrolase [Blastocatellia bacterium]